MSAEFIDIVRAIHLVFLALGMGTAIYLDIKTLSRMKRILTVADLAEIDYIHKIVFAALAGLWLSGLTLIYIRTGFDLASFSPKLWLKLIIVIFLTLNAWLIGMLILPVLKRNLGKPIVALSWQSKLPLAVIASNSTFCWVSGLVLGSSIVVKPLGWDMLIPIFCGLYAIIALASIAITLGMRMPQVDKRKQKRLRRRQISQRQRHHELPSRFIVLNQNRYS